MTTSRSRMVWTVTAVLAMALSAGAAMAGQAAKASLALGGKLPAADVKMKNVDGKELSIGEVKGAKGTLVVFTCNACPYAKAWEERIVELGNTYAAKGVGVIAINSNDPKVVAEDDYPLMVERAKQRGMQYPYVLDSTSGVAKAFGALRTPEVYLFDASGTLVYHGAVDSSAKPEEVKDHYLKAALDSVIEGKPVAVQETKAIGCGIKFRT